jgi:hypothetical protein
VTGLLFTIVFFPLVGLAVSRTNVYLAGTGVTGLALFVTMVWHVPLAITLIALAVVCGALAFRSVKQAPSAPVQERVLAADVALGMAIVLLLSAAAILPLSDYDGRAFWLIKAKAIEHEGAIDGPFFHGRTAGNPRNEYPLLVPLDAAAILTVAGDLDDRHTRLLFALFAVAFALEIRRRLGSWFGAAFLWLPQILLDSANGGALSAYCDIALGAFVACAFFELVGPRATQNAQPLRFGLWVACTALTKNEGLPLAILLLIAGAFVFRKRTVVALALPLIATAHLFLWRAGIERSDEQNFARTLLGVPSQLERFGGSMARLFGDFANLQDWGLVLLMIAVAVFFARRGRPVAAAIIVPMFVLYASAVAVSGWDVDTMNTLAPRVLTHLLGPLFFLLKDAVQPDTVVEPQPA